MCEALLEIMEPEIMEIRRRAKEEGQMEGRAEGRAEGESRSESRIILNMYKKGCSLELIAEVCGKSVEEVEHMVKKQYNK